MPQITIPNNFEPRPYQLPILQAFDKGVKNIDLVAHRRSGKDKVSIAIAAKAMVQRVGGYFYVFPEFNQGRKALWDNLDNDGFQTLRHIHPDLWTSKKDQEMKLTIKNGSYLQVVGSGDVDRLVGSNPVGIIYSEWSLQDPRVFGYLNPIVRANDGWQIFNYTPRGNNHAKNFHERAKSNPAYASFTLSVDDTKLFSEEQLQDIRREYIQTYGDDALFQQEYYCSFNTPVQGSYYGSIITQAEREGRVGKVEYDPGKLVYTAWDLGVSDTTVIWFYQRSGDTVRLIDHYETDGAGMEHFSDILTSKGYKYAQHFLPHDAENRIQAKEPTAISRSDMLKQLGVGPISIVAKSNINDGIQKVRQVLPKCFFDAEKCERGLLCLKEYKKDWSEKNKMWSDVPAHDWASHSADAFRYLALSLQDENTTFDPNIGRETVYNW